MENRSIRAGNSGLLTSVNVVPQVGIKFETDLNRQSHVHPLSFNWPEGGCFQPDSCVARTVISPHFQYNTLSLESPDGDGSLFDDAVF